MGTAPKTVISDISAYPNFPWKEITRFKYETDLNLKRYRQAPEPNTEFVLLTPYLVRVEIDGTKDFIIEAPAGMYTDLASVPWWGRWYASKSGKHLEASIIHDWLYVAWQNEGLEPTKSMRLFADKVFLAGMIEANVSLVKRNIIYQAVRLGGSKVFFTV